MSISAAACSPSRTARTAARIGCIGALLRLFALAMSINSLMAEKHLALGAALTGRPASIVEEVMTVIAMLDDRAVERGAAREPPRAGGAHVAQYGEGG